jgi:hypothetical protein
MDAFAHPNATSDCDAYTYTDPYADSNAE